MPIIKVSDETWMTLNSMKSPSESFEDVMHRILFPLKGQISFKDREEINWEALRLKDKEEGGKDE